MEADELLVATGRRPATGDIGLETVGLEAGSTVKVDDSMRATGVSDGWLYAVGDINGRAPCSPTWAQYQARVCGDVIAARAKGDEPDDLPGLRDWRTRTARRRSSSPTRRWPRSAGPRRRPAPRGSTSAWSSTTWPR
ncbi:hypothetical protein GCM10018952_28560 [Streptosporangium vulgare]